MLFVFFLLTVHIYIDQKLTNNVKVFKFNNSQYGA